MVLGGCQRPGCCSRPSCRHSARRICCTRRAREAGNVPTASGGVDAHAVYNHTSRPLELRSNMADAVGRGHSDGRRCDSEAWKVAGHAFTSGGSLCRECSSSHRRHAPPARCRYRCVTNNLFVLWSYVSQKRGLPVTVVSQRKTDATST